MELYKTMLDQNVKVTDNLNKIEGALTTLTNNIKRLNDDNILHTTEISKELKILNGWVFKIIIILIVIISALAGLKIVQDMLFTII